MKKKLCLLLLALPILVMAQEQGIRFEHGITWKQVKAKAKAEGKFIFMDCYTTWCTPCKMMSDNIFPQKECGEFFNKNFISVKVQMDKTPKDNEAVKAWYKDVGNISTDYEITGFPTFLFFNPNGEIVHRLSGAYNTAKEFIIDASDAFDPNKQFYELKKKYESGNREPEFLRNMAIMMHKMGNDSIATKLATKYLYTQHDFFTKENIEIIGLFTSNVNSNGFEFFLNHIPGVDTIMGNGFTFRLLEPIVFNEEFPKVMSGNEEIKPDWELLKANISKKYPQIEQHAEDIITDGKIIFYGNANNWNKYVEAVEYYLKLNADRVSAIDLNRFAWNMLQSCEDTSYLTSALSWSKNSLQNNDDAICIDTYAKILYKLGRKEEAIANEEKAVKLSGSSNSASYMDVLNKMKKGERI